jgi:hypothetical protein
MFKEQLERILEYFRSEIRSDSLVTDTVRLYEATQSIINLVDKEVEAKNNAYWERNQLVAYLAKQYDSHMVRHPDSDKDWEDDWRYIICIHTPTGQMTWHIHDNDAIDTFGFVEVDPTGEHWDGHTTSVKYNRLRTLAEQRAIIRESK